MAITYPGASSGETLGALWLEDFVTQRGASIVSGLALQNYPVKNLLSPRRSKAWRSPNTTQQQVVGGFAAPSLPKGIALIDANLATPASDFATAYAKAAIWLDVSLETGADASQLYLLADRSGNGRDFVIDSVFLATSLQIPPPLPI